jgi:EAL domain-containing protein (putative c-di-GMP-specific phosphodiesterase class I)
MGAHRGARSRITWTAVGRNAAIRERQEFGLQLDWAVDLGQLRLSYQPVVALDGGEVAGVEALVRWQHPVRGFIAPGEFLETAEENGAILPIGRWVIREACRQAMSWTSLDASVFLSVNVSTREILQPGFVDAVAEALAAAGMAATRLHLEITETALLPATPSKIATLGALRELGVSIAIDDVGTGQVSLRRLRQVPTDALKLARRFVQAPEDDAETAALAGALVALGGSLGIPTIAEGIETPEQAERMRALGCTLGQGYHFARPLPGAAVAAGAFAPDRLGPEARLAAAAAEAAAIEAAVRETAAPEEPAIWRRSAAGLSRWVAGPAMGGIAF